MTTLTAVLKSSRKLIETEARSIPPRNIHVTTPRNIHVTTPRNIHVTTPIMAWHKHFNTKCRVQHFSGPKYKCYLKFYSKYL
jgi:hypothetical protein